MMDYKLVYDFVAAAKVRGSLERFGATRVVLVAEVDVMTGLADRPASKAEEERPEFLTCEELGPAEILEVVTYTIRAFFQNGEDEIFWDILVPLKPFPSAPASPSP